MRVNEGEPVRSPDFGWWPKKKGEENVLDGLLLRLLDGVPSGARAL